MKFFPLLFLCSFLLFACNTDDSNNNNNDPEGNEDPNDNPTPVDPLRIASFSFDNESSIDSLFYENDRLVLVKEYLGDFLEYNRSYTYNDEGMLIEEERIFNGSTLPSYSINYAYNSQGNLESRTRSDINGTTTNNYLYNANQNQVIINQGFENEITVTLNSQNQIISAETMNTSTGETYLLLEYTYDTNGNATHVVDRTFGSNDVREFDFTFDDKMFPFSVFDAPLSNGLTIRQLEAITFISNYGFITIEHNDNLFGFLNKNNVIVVDGSGNGETTYTYSYNDEGYPISIVYPGLDTLQITYY